MDGYDEVELRAEDVAETGGRVVRAEHDENELHGVARSAVVQVRATAAQVKAEAKARRR